MTPSSSAGAPVDLGALEKNLNAAQTAFDLSELIAQTLIGIAGASQASADNLGTLAASQQQGKLAVGVSADSFSGVNGTLACINDSFSGVNGALTGVKEGLHAGAHLLSGTLAVQLRSTVEQLSAIHGTLCGVHQTGKEIAGHCHASASALHRVAGVLESGVKLGRDDVMRLGEVMAGAFGLGIAEIVERRMLEIRNELVLLIETACAEPCGQLGARCDELSHRLAVIERAQQHAGESKAPDGETPHGEGARHRSR